MHDNPEESVAAREVSAHPHVAASASVTVARACMEQVAPVAARGPLSMRIQTVKGHEVELVGSTFFPKNCELEIEIELGTGSSPDSWGSAGSVTHGIVRRTHMPGTSPSYAAWVRLADYDPALLHELELSCEARRESQLSLDAQRLHVGGFMPGWALQLVGDGDLSELQLENISASALSEGMPLDEALVKAGLVLEERVASCMALDQGVPFVDPSAYDIRLANCKLVPEELARRHQLFPLFNLGGVITLGMSDPTNLAIIDPIRLRANCQVDQCLSTPSALAPLIERAYGTASVEASFETPETVHADEQGDLAASSTNAIVRLVNSLVEDSVRDGVSDIHIEPERDKLRVRLRVDGILHERSVHPLQQHAPIISRLKVMAKLDIAETRKPQDGHFGMRVPQGNVDVRLSTIPTVHGENAVLRLLLSEEHAIGLEDLGMPAETLRIVLGYLAHPNGMILVTGPTGSGKTSTLYAALAHLNTMERNVVTVEDPVEKRMPRLRQTEVNPKSGLTFANGLRSILRQDPDIIMVGEIRDRETAEIAVQAALTGHLVLSTLHTNTAAGAIVRLSEIGIPPFMITSSLRAVISQRLARRICTACSVPVAPDKRLIAGLGLDKPETVTFMAGVGCPRCLHTGYKGRVGIYEMLQITPGLSSALLGGAPRDTIKQAARKALTCTLRTDGLRKVREGVTTLEEVARFAGMRHFGEPETTKES